MDYTKAAAEGGAQTAPGRRRVVSYLQSLKDELKKVSWTTQEELRVCTKIVIGATFVFGMGIYLADLTIKGCLDFVALIAYRVFG